MNVRTNKIHQPINDSEQLYAIMKRILLRENRISRDQEHFWLIGLDTKSTLLFVELLALGTENRIIMPTQTIFRISVLKNAKRVIFVHNHPSGNVQPSDADVELTHSQYKAGKTLNIEVYDHLIITEEDYFSMRDQGIINRIKKQESYKISAEKKQIAAENELKAYKRSSAKYFNIAMARKLFKMGLTIEEVAKAVDLSKQDLQDLQREVTDEQG